VRMRCLLISCLLLFPASGLAASIHDRIIQFCRENMDKQVGDGDCYDLAKHALKAAGAKPQGRYPDHPGKNDYVWGQQVLVLEASEMGLQRQGQAKELQPGDVIQFRDTRWEGPRSSGKGRYAMALKHHTAVVSGVEDGGKVVKIYHQNYGGKKTVMEGKLQLDDLKSGWIRCYRPLPSDSK